MALAKRFAAAAGMVLLAACSGSDAKPTPTQTAPPTAVTSPTPTETPATPQSTATTQPAGIDWSHNLAVYTSWVRTEETPTGRLPIVAVVTWDLDANRLAASYEFSGKEGGGGARLAGRDIVTGTAKQVTHSRLDGSGAKTLFVAGDGSRVHDIAVSPDGKLVAVVTSRLDPIESGELHIIDIAKATAVLTAKREDARFAGMRGYFWQAQWRTDGAGVMVHTGTGSEMHGSLATIFLDGRVRVEQVDGYGNVSPTGTLRAGVIGNIGCMFVGSHEFVIRNLEDGTTPVTASDQAMIFTPWEWSPDGKEFVFKQQQATGCEDLSAAKQENWLVRSPDGVSSFGAPERVPDLDALHHHWYGDALFTLDCPPSGEPVYNRWGDITVRCGSSVPWDASHKLFVGGKPAGEGANIEPVGLLRP